MASITITINDNIAVDVRDTLAKAWGMTDFETSNNSQKLAFLKARIAFHLIKEYAAVKGEIAGDAARLAAIAAANQADIT